MPFGAIKHVDVINSAGRTVARLRCQQEIDDFPDIDMGECAIAVARQLGYLADDEPGRCVIRDPPPPN